MAAGATLAVLATRWPLRSHALFSLNQIFHDPDTALVVWNMVATTAPGNVRVTPAAVELIAGTLRIR